jgi:signal transduction histidine kinase
MKLKSRALLAGLSTLRLLLGTPALVFGFFSLLMFASGLIIVHREYDRLNRTGQELVRRVMERWTRTASSDYLGLRNLVDEVETWRGSTSQDEESASLETAESLRRMGAWFESQGARSPLFEILELRVFRSDRPAPIVWRSRSTGTSDSRWIRVPLLAQAGPLAAVWVDVLYQVESELGGVIAGLETSYRRLLLAVVGLSGYSLLCLIYTGVHAQTARKQSADEAARRATIELADRTCHELGNLAYVLGNERRNLDDHLDLAEAFLDQERQALDAAIARAGIDSASSDRLRAAWERERSARGIAALDLRESLVLARAVCHQISICSKYMNLTVRELDSYLKQTRLPLQIEPVELWACVDDAMLLLAPILEASAARVERVSATETPSRRVLADRRLLVHALVNVIKNALEAAAKSTSSPLITFRVRESGTRGEIEINDNGPGIAPQDLKRLFDAGYSTKGANRGRGLAIVQSSVESQGGSIEVTSDQGAGACFHISLPLEPQKRASSSGLFLLTRSR